MADKIRIYRGQFSSLPSLETGRMGLTTDTGQIFIGHANGNLEISMKAPSTAQSIYMATSTYGGDTNANGKTGLELESGTTTSGAYNNRLYDSSANFTSSLVGETVYNVTADKWAKVTGFTSSTELVLSAGIMDTAGGEDYVIASALDNLPDAFKAISAPYLSNTTVYASPGTFSDDATLVGKGAGGDYTLKVLGSTTSTTTISGDISVRQRLTFSNLTFTGRVLAYFGADITWDTCTCTAKGIFKYTGSNNSFTSSTVTFANDPGDYTAVSSTVNKGYTMYVATSALGGDDTVADGLGITSGTATGTTANKLVDSGASFDSSVLNKTVYNSTDDTWAEVTAVDSATQLSLDTDIMATGEDYVIANAFQTVQAAVDAIPGSFNCDTTIKISNGTFSEDVTIRGKYPTGSYKIYPKGTRDTAATSGTLTAYSSDSDTYYIDDSGKSWSTDAYKGYLVEASDQQRLVESNTGTRLRIIGKFSSTPSGAYTVYKTATLIDSLSIQPGQVAVEMHDIELTVALSLVPPGAELTAYNSRVVSSGDVILWANGTLTTYACYSYSDSTGRNTLMQTPGAKFTAQYSWIRRSGFQYAVDVGVGSMFYAVLGTVISEAASHGVYASENALTRSHWTSNVGERCRILNNGGYGLYAEMGAQAKWASNSYYNGNTSGTYTSVSASYGYAS